MSSLRYTVRVEAPTRHTVDVTLRFVPEGDSTDLTMPAWCPGSYLIRDYARFIRDLRVDCDDERRPATKIDKQTWRVDTAGAKKVTVSYTLYAHDLTVRTNHVDPTHAFLHGPATFLFPVSHRTVPIEVAIEGPADWQLATSMTWEQSLPATVLAATIDDLFDNPIHIGVSRTYPITASVPVRLVIWGDRGQGGVFNETRLAEDLSVIVEDHIARLGETPFPHYTFVLMLAHEAYGGLEHKGSSVNMFNPHFAASRKSYEGLLELLSHELLHAWNGKRIAPKPLLDFDYTREAYTPCLWVMEGMTSHYDRYALRTSQRITAKSFLEKTLDDWTRLMATPGRARQSLEQSSFDAWIKLYKPDESNLNSTVSYYLKGALTMLAMDLHIRRRTEGNRSLDDVLRALWTRFGAKGIPHPDDLQPVFEEAAGIALGDIFERQIRGTSDPELPQELRHLGLELRGTHDPAQLTDGASAVWLGATTQATKVTGVFDQGPAHAAGLSPQDEIIAIDRFRTSSDAEIRNLVGARRIGDEVVVSVFRRHRLVDLKLVLGPAPHTRYEIGGIPDAGAAAARYQAWLIDAHPGAQTLATVTTTARWV